jgi:large subunit ribosomal protein L31e
MAEEKQTKKKKEEGSEIVIEREYNVPLRKEWLKTAKYKRAKKSIRALRDFLKKHMKSEEVKIGKYANLEIWKHGIKNPPHHIKVKVTKNKNGVVVAELVNKPTREKVPSILKKARAKFEKQEKKKKVEEKAKPAETKISEPKGAEKKEAPAKKAEDSIKDLAKQVENVVDQNTVKKETKTEEKPVETKKTEPTKTKETPKT